MTIEDYIMENLNSLYPNQVRPLVKKVMIANDKLDESIKKAEDQYIKYGKNIPKSLKQTLDNRYEKMQCILDDICEIVGDKEFDEVKYQNLCIPCFRFWDAD